MAAGHLVPPGSGTVMRPLRCSTSSLRGHGQFRTPATLPPCLMDNNEPWPNWTEIRGSDGLPRLRSVSLLPLSSI
ncbi:hypothetical protein AAFF_G00110930 [Aldrovandia affinis]|uniref:Uncharacterized protein n=1 Tax=Aldrovandia affinis TaxID=143900 RepID=A0AAD7RTG2_9TELE|nr:hypothetical protein AAFF_G00110930 [Aldrovandia affinis]